jgi:hypothetical protein
VLDVIGHVAIVGLGFSPKDKELAFEFMTSLQDYENQVKRAQAAEALANQPLQVR